MTFELPCLSSLHGGSMAVFHAALQHRQPRTCSHFLAASARSGKIKFTGWAPCGHQSPCSEWICGQLRLDEDGPEPTSSDSFPCRTAARQRRHSLQLHSAIVVARSDCRKFRSLCLSKSLEALTYAGKVSAVGYVKSMTVGRQTVTVRAIERSLS